MKYKHKFIEKLKKEFPDCKKLSQLIEENSVFIGRYLEKRTTLIFEPEEIINAFMTGKEHWIKEEAEKILRVRNLYKEWKHQYERAVKKGKQSPIEIYYV